MWLSILTWLPRNIAGILGLIQAIIKAIKEILTILANLAFIPQNTIEKIRAVVNKIDEWVENIKGFLLNLGGN